MSHKKAVGKQKPRLSQAARVLGGTVPAGAPAPLLREEPWRNTRRKGKNSGAR